MSIITNNANKYSAASPGYLDSSVPIDQANKEILTQQTAFSAISALNQVITGPLTELEILACLFSDLNFFGEKSPEEIAQILYQINTRFDHKLFQGKKIRSPESIRVYFQNNKNTWSELELDLLKTASKTIQYFQKTFRENINFYRENLGELMYLKFTQINNLGIKSCQGLFPGKDPNDLEITENQILFEKDGKEFDDLIGTDSFFMLISGLKNPSSAEENLIETVLLHLSQMNSEDLPLIPFTDEKKLIPLLNRIPGLSSDFYWTSISPFIEKGPLKPKEALILFLQPSLLERTDYSSRWNVSKRLHEYGKLIEDASGNQNKYRTPIFIESLFQNQTSEWMEEDIQRLYSFISGFELAYVLLQKPFSFPDPESRLRFRTFFAKQQDGIIKELLRFFPGKTEDSIQSKWIESITHDQST